MKHRILIAEEQNLLRQGLRAMIGALPDFDVVGEARDGKATLDGVLQLRPDLVLLDLSLPIVSGIEVTTQIKRRLPQTRVVALTGLDADGHVRETLRAGADGYLLKTASYEELLIALRSVMVGKRFLSPDLSAHVVDSFVHNTPGKPRPSPWDKLTPRERSVLKLVAEGHTNRAAAAFLHVSPKTVEKHRASLMRKLGLRNVSELTLAALECGLIERPGTVSRLLGPIQNGADSHAAEVSTPFEPRRNGAAAETESTALPAT